MKLKLRTTKEGPHTKTTVFIDKQNVGTLVFRGEEYETFLLALVGGSALLRETECNKRVELEIDDQR